MEGYTVLNLEELENLSPKFGFAEDDMQFRMGRDPLGCEQSGVSLLRLGPGSRAPFGHRHTTQEEIYLVLRGRGHMKLGDDVVDVEPLSAVRVAPKTWRCYEGGPDGCDLLVFGAPRTGPDDVEVQEGWWSD